MGRKKVADMTPDELESHREYMRKSKAKSREGKPPEKQIRSSRAEYMREYRKNKKAENMNITDSQIANEITNTIRVCINNSAIIDLSDQSKIGDGYFLEYNGKTVKINKKIYEKVINQMEDKRDFNTSPFDYKEDYFLTKLGFTKEELYPNF